jgi:hypothetical protein
LKSIPPCVAILAQVSIGSGTSLRHAFTNTGNESLGFAGFDRGAGLGMLSRNMRDRRAVARYGGLTGSPDESGKKRREKGLARSGTGEA